MPLPLPELMMPDDEHPVPHAAVPSQRALGYHAMRMTLMSIRQQMESALALLAALESEAPPSPAHANNTAAAVMERGSLSEQAANVFGRVRAKQTRPPGDTTP